MCFTASGYFNTKTKAEEYFGNPIISDKSVVVYKILELKAITTLLPNCYEGLSSPFQREPYSLSELKIVSNFKCIIVDCISEFRVNINVGIHSYTTSSMQLDLVKSLWGYKQNKYVLLKCIIPKGTPHYINKIGEVVSLKLKLPKTLKNFW